MIDKKFSSSQGTPSKNLPGEKAKVAPATARPTTKPGQKPAEVAPARKP